MADYDCDIESLVGRAVDKHLQTFAKVDVAEERKSTRERAKA